VAIEVVIRKHKNSKIGKIRNTFATEKKKRIWVKIP